MNRQILPRLLMLACAVSLGVHQGQGQTSKGAGKCNGNGNCQPGQMKTTRGQRKAARTRQASQKVGVNKQFAGVSKATATLSPLAVGPAALAAMSAPLSTPDYFAIANWANSALPLVDPATGIVTGGIHKFRDALPGLCGVSAPNTLGQCLPLATPDKTTFPGSDFYRIGLNDYNRQLHSELPATKIRGYVDLIADPTGTQHQYLGPVILATRNRPVRVLFQNNVDSKSFIPLDTTYMGATVNGTPASEKRATLHLHGGNTPWISDGTAHQWITPAGGDGQAASPGFAKGYSFQNVPDMVGADPATGLPRLIPNPSLTDGLATFLWPNQQSGRFMFFHDHAYGITRLNVYAGEAAGYLLVDPAQESALAAATVPGTIVTDPATGQILSADLAHLIPLVIQDKTFVPDSGAAGGQLAATDPTWDLASFGGAGNLWFPHVYMPNQNPYDISGASAYGRWDYGPWFWPIFSNLMFGPVQCSSAAYPGQTLTCPATPNPSGTPEAFMDTPIINGTAYPTLTVDPVAYRFQILSAGNDRTLNLQLYVAEPLSISVANGGSGYSLTPTVTINGDGTGAAAAATVSSGSVEFIDVATGGSGYAAPTVTIAPPAAGTPATATALAAGGVITSIIVTNGGSGYTTAPAITISDAAGTGGSAVATITPAGTITDITVTNPGANYTFANVSITDATGTGAVAVASANTEVRMLSAVPRGAGNPPLCGSVTQMTGSGLAIATLDGAGQPINGTGLPAGCWPVYTGGLPWPTDGRDGGVPDPSTAGPPIIEIATEAGLLPAPAVIPSTPVGYDYNRKSITVLNVLNHGLYLGPADRADVVVDFSQFAGKTLILYNDAPAPVPAGDPRVDYYTNNPDQSMMGGTPSTMAGYGPNTRTMMQIKVNGSASTPNTFSLAALKNALPNIFAATQDTIIVPESAFPAGNGKGPDTYVRIQDTSLKAFIGSPIGGITLTSGGAGYTSTPAVSIEAPPFPCPRGLQCVQATATANIAPTAVQSLALTSGGAGYTSVPTVSISGGGGSGATATAVLATRSVASVSVSKGGNKYTSAPAVTFSAPQTAGGTTATGTATVSKNAVTAVTVTNPGSGYISAPTVTFTGGGGSGATATATLTTAAVARLTLSNGGSGFMSAPAVTISGGGGSGAAATAVLAPTTVASISVTNPGNGYTFAPTVTIAPPSSAGSTATAVVNAPITPILPKTIQELFTLDYGRMNATLGVELPFTTSTVQTTIPYGYADPPTEIFKDGETQLWKVTHNGVDTHFIHFHLFTVQLINRVGWDGAIKPPDPNEVAWKDTVRMNPLEDVIVALRPMRQTDDLGVTGVAPGLPFELPNSVRPLDVTMPVGSNMPNEFTNVDPTNQPATVINDLTNFGWEYVWHCHILGHEENDMMRAMSMAVPPASPGTPVATVSGRNVVVRWTDRALNETGFTIQRAQVINGVANTFTNVGTVGVNQTTFTDTTASRRTTYVYRVVANNMVGYTRSYAAPAVGYPHVSADSSPSLTSNSVTP